MGENTGLKLSSPTRKALRTTVSNIVVKFLGLTYDGKLDWEMKIIDGKPVFVVKKVKEEKGKERR